MKKIIFIGNKNTAYYCLKYLIERSKEKQNEFSLESVITPLSDIKPQWYKSVYHLSKKYKIPVHTPKNINDPKFIKKIQSYHASMAFCIFYPTIFKKPFIDMFPERIINLHFAPLPAYRGCNPIPHAIIDEQKKHGVTLHYIDSKIDAGPIISQELFPIKKDDTGLDVYKKCEVAGLDLFIKNFDKILKSEIKITIQDETKAVHHYRKELLTNKEIQLTWSKKKIYNFARALEFPPFEPAYIEYNGKKIFLTTKPDKKYTVSHLEQLFNQYYKNNGGKELHHANTTC